MDPREEFLAWAKPALHAAEAALVTGDPSRRIEMWSHREPVSLFGAVGVSATGWTQLEPTFRRVASRLTDGQDVTLDVMAYDVVGDMAYTAAVVRFTGTIDGSAPRPFALRATSVFRREEGEWKVIHEHTDFVSPEDTMPSGGS